MNMGLGSISTGYLGLLPLEPRIMFDGSGIDLGEISYKLPDDGEDVSIPVVVVEKDRNIFSKGSSYSADHYVRLHLDHATDSDKLFLKSDPNPNGKGAISVGDDRNAAGNHDLYLGIGKARIRIGEVKGQHTGDLRIRFLDRVANHDFENSIEEKDLGGDSIVFGLDEIAGKEVPLYPGKSPYNDSPDYDPVFYSKLGSGDLKPNTRTSQWNVERDKNADGTHYLNIWSKGLSVAPGGRAYGPYAVSDEFELIGGETFNFQWRLGETDPLDSGDLPDPFFYLLNTGNGEMIVLHEGETFLRHEGERIVLREKALPKTISKYSYDEKTGWYTWELPVSEKGTYRLVSITGAIDSDSLEGGSTGVALNIDNLQVGLAARVLNGIVERVTYTYAGPSEPSPDPRKITISAKLDDNPDTIAYVDLDISNPPSPTPLPIQTKQNMIIGISSSPRINESGYTGSITPSPLPDILSDYLVSMDKSDPLDKIDDASPCDDPGGYCPVTVGCGIADTFILYGQFSFRIPSDTFMPPEANVQLEAMLVDGSMLPDWIRFDPGTGTFTGEAPRFPEERILSLRIIARDPISEREVQTTFDLHIIGDDKGNTNSADKKEIGGLHGGHPGFFAQLAAVGKTGFETDQATLIAIMSGTD